VVRLRRDVLATVYGILLIVLLIANWVGIRERYVVSSLPCTDVAGMAVGDVDVRSPGDELVFWKANDIYVVCNVTAGPKLETAYTQLPTDDNRLTGMAIADFMPERKGQEIMAVTENGTVLLLWRAAGFWNSTNVASLPWPSPVWTTRAVVGARLDASVPAAELAIAGEYFDWPTMNRTGRVLVVSPVTNVTWQVSLAYTSAKPLVTAAAGDLDPHHPGLELLTAAGATLRLLAVTNGSWSSRDFFTWVGIIPSITVGNINASRLGYEVAIVKDGKFFLFSYNGTAWDPDQIAWSGDAQISLQTLTACDVDPSNAGDEVLGLGVNVDSGDSVLLVLEYNGLLWTNRILLVLPKGYVAATQAGTFDFSRVGTEIVVAGRDVLSIYAIPNFVDRTVRATSAVLLPAVVLLPSTVVLFVLADHVGRVAVERRRKYGLLMAAKGFVQCPICKRFLPRANLGAHRRMHSRQQLVISR
jgi:hypothetical protein